MEALASVDLHGFELMGISFENQGTLCAQFSKDGTLTLQGIDAVIASLDGEIEEERVEVKVDTLSYGIESRYWKIQDMKFHIPHSKIERCTTILAHTFPEYISSYTAKSIQGLKQQGPLQGSLSASSSTSGSEVTLHLDDGTYFFKGEPYDIKEHSLFLNAQDLRMHWTFLYQSQQLWAAASIAANSPSQGNLMVHELPPQEWKEKKIEPLTISWVISPRDEIHLKKVQGSCAGFTADLNVISNGEKLVFQGTALLDLKSLQPFCSDALSRLITHIKLGSGYELKGIFSIPKKHLRDVSFEGSLSGNHYIFEDYELSDLQAQLSISPNKITIQSLKMRDDAGELSIDRCTAIKKEDGEWYFDLPALKIANLRPSLLHKSNEKAGARKPLVFTEISVGRLSGPVSDVNHWKGTGSITFRNIPKKNFLNTLWAIPDELISTIGLNLGLLTPVRGSVDCVIKDGKIYLKRFRDVYSKNERSRFYLPDQHLRSYVDFDGNLNLRVRMKHYNLLFKLTELLTISISGNIDRPVYSLQDPK